MQNGGSCRPPERGMRFYKKPVHYRVPAPTPHRQARTEIHQAAAFAFSFFFFGGLPPSALFFPSFLFFPPPPPPPPSDPACAMSESTFWLCWRMERAAPPCAAFIASIADPRVEASAFPSACGTVLTVRSRAWQSLRGGTRCFARHALLGQRVVSSEPISSRSGTRGEVTSPSPPPPRIAAR